ncbi:hypothetical protein BJF78_17420 [Pseudonocardia sp. CNS-139]|nr:hypothetical protein BJF78_17420 [Pseudonocardia sp. CNS-139]
MAGPGAPDPMAGTTTVVTANGPLPAADPGQAAARRAGHSTTVHIVQSPRLSIGRLTDNDVVIDDLLVSRRHAVLELRPDGGWELLDLGSGNGTFLNGTRVQRARVTAADLIGIGRAVLRLQGDRLVTVVDSGDVAFAAHGLTVTVGEGRRLLDDVSFSLPGRCLLAIVGPSGAGKSTLLRALTGARPADAGHVRYDGRDLYAAYDELRHRIGLVPQDDVLHPQLTVRRALRFAARLRFPADVAEADRERRIEEVLTELGLTAQADQRIDTLSGGQRKRTSVALELLTKPSLLFLDEPTSGLDPGLDRSVMRMLRGLADQADDAGRTVVVVTHSVLNLESATCCWCSRQAARRLLRAAARRAGLLRAGRLRRHVPAARPGAGPGARPAVPGVAAPRAPHRGRHGRAAPGAGPAGRAGRGAAAAGLVHPARRAVPALRRGDRADRQYVLFLLALPLLLSVLARLVPGESGLSAASAAAVREPQPNQLLLVLVIGGALMGIAASIREFVKERPVFRRERAIGLSLSAYLTSKMVVLGAVTVVQAVLFTLLATVGLRMPDEAVVLGAPLVEVLLAVVAVTVLTMVVGLVASAFIDNADRGMPLLVLVLMVQLVVSGGLFPVHDRPVLEQLAWLVPSRWAYAMGAATTDLNVNPISPGEPDPLWEHAADPWFSPSACSPSSWWCCSGWRRGCCAGWTRSAGRSRGRGRSAVDRLSMPWRERRSAHRRSIRRSSDDRPSAGPARRDPVPGGRPRRPGRGDVAAGLSRESRYVRLHPAVPRFTGPTWRVLTGSERAPAIGLVAATVTPWQVTVGVAGLSLLGGGAARVAVAVGDPWQGLGIGRALLGSLGELAAAIGVQELHAELPVQAHGLARVFRAAFPRARTTWAGPLVRVCCPVPRPAAPAHSLRAGVLSSRCASQAASS